MKVRRRTCSVQKNTQNMRIPWTVLHKKLFFGGCDPAGTRFRSSGLVGQFRTLHPTRSQVEETTRRSLTTLRSIDLTERKRQTSLCHIVNELRCCTLDHIGQVTLTSFEIRLAWSLFFETFEGIFQPRHECGSGVVEKTFWRCFGLEGSERFKKKAFIVMRQLTEDGPWRTRLCLSEGDGSVHVPTSVQQWQWQLFLRGRRQRCRSSWRREWRRWVQRILRSVFLREARLLSCKVLTEHFSSKKQAMKFSCQIRLCADCIAPPTHTHRKKGTKNNTQAILSFYVAGECFIWEYHGALASPYTSSSLCTKQHVHR